MTDAQTYQAADEMVLSSRRLDNDVNGNPRYYVPAFMFSVAGTFFRPKFASKYRGKAYGAGWVFQSYNLREDLFTALRA